MPFTGEAKRAYQRDLMRKRREGVSSGSEVGGDKSSGVVEGAVRAKIAECREDPKDAFEHMAGVGQFIATPPPIEEQHTKTDQLFENKKPGYYIFEKEVIKKKCWYCSEEFETRLRLNRFCSPDHKERWLTMSFRMGKE